MTTDVVFPSVFQGSRVLVWDPQLYINDKKTPDCMRPATVVCRYGYISEWIMKEIGRDAAKYSDSLDVVFDHRPEKVSKGHFTHLVEEL